MKAKQLRRYFLKESSLLDFKTHFKIAIGLFLVLAIHSNVFAQQIEITGVVSGPDGEPIPAVSVVIEGTTTGTATNIDGEYTITAPSDGALVFSSIGYITHREEIDGRSLINIQMEESVALLDELIVTGYTAQRRADITGAVSTVNVESAARQTTSSVLQRLGGRVSGVTVDAGGSPGARSTVRIRGISSFGNNEPLYIIDGTPVQDSFMNFINPNDIESIQVLKDASAASIYGSRANNGVVIIETRKGRDSAPEISVDVRTGISNPVNGYDSFLILDALEYHEVVRRAHVNANLNVPRNIYGDPNNPSIPNYIWPNDGVNQTNSLSPFGLTEEDYAYENSNRIIMPGSAGTNWWDAVFGTGYTQDYNISVRGGGSGHRYNVSFNYFDQEGTAIHNHFQRGTVRVNTEFDVGRFTIGENIAFSIQETIGGLAGDGLGEGNIIGKNILKQPVVPVFDIGGNYASGKAPGLGNTTNPQKIAWANRNNPSRNLTAFGNAFARANLMENLVFNTRFGFNASQGTFQGFSMRTPEDSEPTTTDGFFELQNQNIDWTWSNTLNYINTFAGVHSVNVLLGQEANKGRFRQIQGNIGQLVTPDVNARYIQDAVGNPETKNVTSFGSFGSLLSFFGKIDYNYDERYHISATVRHDGSSRLGPENRWGTFPAFSFGWRISNESFMQEQTFFSNIMLRAGWGITGNQAIPAGAAFDRFGGSTGNTFYDIRGTGSSLATGFRQTDLGNPELKWEENESINVGVDLEFFEGRFNLVLDVYQRDTDNLLFRPNIPATASLATPPFVNIGKMRNTGFDISLGYRNDITRDLSVSVTLNGGHYKNEILRIDGDQEFFNGPVGARFGNPVRNMIGHPIGAFFGLQTDGIFANEAEVAAHADQDGAAPGRFRFVDVNGDGVINADDRTIIGDPHPDFIAGLDLGVQYRNWDINANFFGTFGNDIFDIQQEFYVFRNFNTNVRRDLLTKAAVVENGQVTNLDSAIYPQLDMTDTFSRQYSDFWVKDGSYVRLRTLQVGYTFAPDAIPGFRNLRVFVMGENLFTITNYPGLDPALPAISASSGGVDVRDQARGLDRGSYPSNRTLSLGISATF